MDQRPIGADPHAPTAPVAHTNGCAEAPPGTALPGPQLEPTTSLAPPYTSKPPDQELGQAQQHENGHRPKRQKREKRDNSDGQRSEPLRVRRVRRVVRHVGLMSVFRLASALYLSFLLVATIATIGLWIVASVSGARHTVEKFISQTLLLRNFGFNSIQLLLSFIVIGVVLAIVAAGLTVVAGSFYNLISDVAGGLEISVIEEEPQPQQPVRVS